MEHLKVDWAKGIVSAVVVILFGYAYARNPGDEMMKGALIAAFSLTISYWLGSSKGSDEKTQLLAESNNGQPKEVKVINTARNPVQTEEADMGGELPEGEKL